MMLHRRPVRGRLGNVLQMPPVVSRPSEIRHVIAQGTNEALSRPPARPSAAKDFDTGWMQTDGADASWARMSSKKRAAALLEENRHAFCDAQELLYADSRYAMLVVLQALDAAGKDGTIKHVMSGVNPQGCQVFSFKKPSSDELSHNFLWRCMRCLPERGRIGIFKRSYYEDVLVVKVHPELLDQGKLPPGKRNKAFWQNRYEDINAFERHLTRNGIAVVKLFLHVSKDEQKRRFLDRFDRPRSIGSSTTADLAERGGWDEYVDVYEEPLSRHEHRQSTVVRRAGRSQMGHSLESWPTS